MVGKLELFIMTTHTSSCSDPVWI